MKFASSYRQTDLYDQLDEIHFSQIVQIINYCNKNPINNKSLCLEILKIGSIEINGKESTLELYLDFQKKYPFVRLEFYELEDLKAFAAASENGLYNFHYGVSDFNLLKTLIDLHVSDIIIDEPFTFNVQNVAAYIRGLNEGCKIHMRPYLGKPGWMLESESILHHFWVLPQHIHLYDEYIDYVDLFADAEQREAQLIKLYCVDKYYPHELPPLVLNGTEDDMAMRGGYVTDELAQQRTCCRQVCMSTYPQRCHVCDLQLQTFKMFKLGRHHTKAERQEHMKAVLENLKNK